MSTLDAKTQAVAAAAEEYTTARRAIANNSDAKGQQRSVIAREQAALTRLEAGDAALYATRAKTEAALDAAEEDLIGELVVTVSGLLVRLNYLDPVAHYSTIQTVGTVLRSAVRGELDAPRDPITGQLKYAAAHAVVAQALALVPVRAEMDRPVFELGAAVVGQTDWATRRNRLIPRLAQFFLDLTQLVAKVSATEAA